MKPLSSPLHYLRMSEVRCEKSGYGVQVSDHGVKNEIKDS